MSAAGEADLARAVLETVREASAETSLITAEEVLEGLRARGFAERLETPEGSDPCRRVAAVLSGLPDIASFASRSGRTVYHDPALLSRTYARLLDHKDAPEALLAEAIRSNSRDYPRPVPAALFEQPPFDLAPEAVEATLRAMAARPEYQDLAAVRTSMGTVYLFSSLYLERGQATFLAEQDEALAMNP
ncbi:MAG: hypothetical protein ACLGQH_10475 [Acidobacteriota bacterium]